MSILPLQKIHRKNAPDGIIFESSSFYKLQLLKNCIMNNLSTKDLGIRLNTSQYEVIQFLNAGIEVKKNKNGTTKHIKTNHRIIVQKIS